MNNKNKTTEVSGNSNPGLLAYLKVILAGLALLSTGLGGMFHFLLEGRDYPEFQMLVLRFSALALILSLFVVALTGAGMIAAESGRFEGDHEGSWKKWGIRSAAAIVIITLMLTGLMVLVAGAEIFGQGLRDFTDSVKQSITSSTGG